MFSRQMLAIALGAFALCGPVPQAIAQRAAPKAEPHVKTEAIIMLQNDATMAKRASNVEAVGRYLKGVRETFDQAHTNVDVPETISAVVAIKPGKKARIWLVSSLPNPPDRAGHMMYIEVLPVPEVEERPVAFAIQFTVAGAPMEKIPMFPPEWNSAFGGQQVMMPDAITAYIWKD